MRAIRLVVAGILLFFPLAGVEAQDSPPADDAPPPADEGPPAADFDFDFDFEDPFAPPSDDPLEDPSDGDEGAFDFQDPFAPPSDNPMGEETDGDGGGDETGGDDFDLDSFFGSDQMVEEIDTEEQNAAPQDDLLVEEGVTWNGRISGSVSADWTWDTFATSAFDVLSATDISLSPSLSSELNFDARPSNDFRAFGSFRISASAPDDGAADPAIDAGAIDEDDLPEGWTSEEDPETGETEIRDQNGILIATLAPEEEEEEVPVDEPATGSTGELSFSVFELFSDFAFDDSVFFRFGKHTIEWGVGFFFSPADVLNLSAIDPEDPSLDREGPISLRTRIPFGLNSFDLYTIFNFNANPLDIALAPRLDLVLDDSDLSISAYYQRALAPRLIATGATTLGDFDVFGEAVVSFGADRVFVRRSRDQSAATENLEDDLEVVLDTYTIDTFPFFSGTLGARLIDSIEDVFEFTFVGQYFFNGTGYADSALLKPAAFLIQNPDTNGLAIANPDDQPAGYEEPPALRAGDFQNWGRHYGAATLVFGNLFGSDLSLSLFGLVNFSDLSGIFSPSVSISFLEWFNASVGARMTFGDPGDEYTNPAALLQTGDEGEEGPTLQFTLSLSVGGGSF